MKPPSYIHEPSGVSLYKEIAQPNVTTFAECFPDWEPWPFFGKAAKNYKSKFQSRYVSGQNIAGNLFKNGKRILCGDGQTASYPDEQMRVGPYCSHRNIGNGSFAVSCADWVLSRIKERTIVMGDDRMSFEIVDHDNGWSLVIANHSQILGSVWLAYIKTDSIPRVEEVAA